METFQNVAEILKRHGIQPSAQRVAIAQYVLTCGHHPTADQVQTQMKKILPMVSRATIYNTLNLFVAKGLLRTFQLGDAGAVFDANVDAHHHFIDDETGQVTDIPWEAVEVKNIEALSDFEVRSYTVVMRGRGKR
jgi:Fur family transcriptional regulator, iron response regulator